MVKVADPTIAYSTVILRRRQARAMEDGNRFRLGVHVPDCGSSSNAIGRGAVIGASGWALKPAQIEQTLQIIGLVGGLLTDLGFQVCPIGADSNRRLPSFVVWVCGDETRADEYEQLVAMGVVGLSIGSIVHGLDDWGYISPFELKDVRQFVRRFTREIERRITNFERTDAMFVVPAVEDPEPEGTILAQMVGIGFRGPQVCRLVGLTYRQLDYFARTDLVRPSIVEARGSGTQRRYSYKDLLLLKVVVKLLDGGMDLSSVRRSVDVLRQLGESIVSAEILTLEDGSVLVRSGADLLDPIRQGQLVLDIFPLAPVASELNDTIQGFNRRKA